VLCAIRHDERFKAIFSRLLAKHGIKMKAVVAVQRKMLEMIFTLATKKVKYEKAYLSKQAGATEATAVNKQAA
jgi:transposase